MRASRCLPWIIAALIALSGRAENVSPKPSIGVAVSDIFDNRGTVPSSGGCRIFLTLSGDAVADAHSIRRVHVINARDELGRDLTRPVDATGDILENASSVTPIDEQRRIEAVTAEVARRRALREGLASSVTPSPMPISPTRPLTGSKPSINLRNPSRQSATIKIIEGEIELFSPTEANGGILHLDKPFATPAVFVANEALKTSAIQLMYLVPDTYATDREAAGPNTTGPWSEEFASQFKGYATLPATARRQTAFFFLNDPNRLVMDLELRTPDGKRLDRGVFRSGLAQLRGLSFDGSLPADTQLIVRIATPSAVTAYPFKLENIPLP